MTGDQARRAVLFALPLENRHPVDCQGPAEGCQHLKDISIAGWSGKESFGCGRKGVHDGVAAIWVRDRDRRLAACQFSAFALGDVDHEHVSRGLLRLSGAVRQR